MDSIFPLTVALGVVLATYSHFFDPLYDIPGPKLARWSRLWLVYHSWKGDMHTTMMAMHHKYGKLVRTGPNEVSIVDPSAMKMIYGAGTKFRKSDWYSVFQGHRKFDLFGERDEKVHGAQRRLVSNVYSMDSLKQLEPYVDKTLRVFLDQLSTLERKPVNMGLWAQLFAFDVIGEVTFSKRFGFLEACKDDGTFNQINIALKSASWIGQVPWLYWLHDRLMPIMGNWLGVNARHGSLRAFAATEVENRKGRGSDHRDILGMLKEVQNVKPKEFNDMAVLSMATSNVFAGSDTTAFSIDAVLYHLCKSPEATKKLREEMKSMESELNSSWDTWPLAVADKMPYLQACIYEALRLHPAVGMSMPRVVSDSGIEAGGIYIPQGTTVGTNSWIIHRDKDIFGNDANDFRPERWLGENRGQLQRYFFTFGAGARMCIGRNLSWIEMTKLIPSLLRRWDIELVDADSEPRLNCWWFVKYENLQMVFTPRK